MIFLLDFGVFHIFVWAKSITCNTCRENVSYFTFKNQKFWFKNWFVCIWLLLKLFFHYFLQFVFVIFHMIFSSKNTTCLIFSFSLCQVRCIDFISNTTVYSKFTRIFQFILRGAVFSDNFLLWYFVFTKVEELALRLYFEIS